MGIGDLKYDELVGKAQTREIDKVGVRAMSRKD